MFQSRLFWACLHEDLFPIRGHNQLYGRGIFDCARLKLSGTLKMTFFLGLLEEALNNSGLQGRIAIVQLVGEGNFVDDRLEYRDRAV
jgi:hypothetical protein